MWQTIQHKSRLLNEEKRREALFDGRVSTEAEQGELAGEIEALAETYAVSHQALEEQRDKLPEASGLAAFVQSLLSPARNEKQEPGEK